MMGTAIDDPDKIRALKELAERLRAERIKRGESLYDVLMATGINVARIEMGKRNPSYLTLRDLCHHYEITLSDLFSGQ